MLHSSTEAHRSRDPHHLTFSVGGAADDIGEFGLQAGISARAGLAYSFVLACAQRYHTLHRRVGPQTLALMDGQSGRVVDQETTVLQQHHSKVSSGKAIHMERNSNIVFKRRFQFLPK